MIATGSSELRQKSKDFDTMAGRFNEIYCLPFSIYEIFDNQKHRADEVGEFKRQLAKRLQIFGAYPSTVSNYIEIFIKNYILISLPSFKTNIRKAVSENRKLYFYDLGIRNILIQDFRDLKLRQDKGGVFENFIISELEKMRKLSNAKVSMYFYREYGGKEVDLVIEDYHKRYNTVEIKVQGRGGNRDIFPLPHTFITIDTNNYFEKITQVLEAFPRHS